MSTEQKQWDIFISHASEDKAELVRPLAAALLSLGLSVWYDEFALVPGMSLTRSVDKGLAQSRYGLVVLSPYFLSKPFPEHELRGLVIKDIEQPGTLVPIWHGVSKEQVLVFSPPLADKVAIKTAETNAQDVAIQILRTVRPDLYNSHPRSYLARLASGETIRELQEQIDRTTEELATTQEELAEYRCPYCRAELVGRNDVALDSDERDWDTVETFGCGYQLLAGLIQRPCPADPRFPKLDNYELRFRPVNDDPLWKWQCYALAKTDMAKMVNLGFGLGKTKEEAENHLREEYKRYSQK